MEQVMGWEMGNTIGAIRQQVEAPRVVPAGPRKLERLLAHMQGLRKTEFTGEIRINFTQGSIGRVEQVEEMIFSS